MRKFLPVSLSLLVMCVTAVALAMTLQAAPRAATPVDGWSSFGQNATGISSRRAVPTFAPVADPSLTSPSALSVLPPVSFDRVVPDRLDVSAVGQSAPTSVEGLQAALPAAPKAPADVPPVSAPAPSPVPSVPVTPVDGVVKLYGSLPFASSTDAADPLTLAKRFAWDMGSIRTCSDGSFPECARAVWGRPDPWNEVAGFHRVFDLAFAKFEALGAVISHNRSSTPPTEGAWSSYYRFEIGGSVFHVTVGGSRPGCPAGAICSSYSVSPA